MLSYRKTEYTQSTHEGKPIVHLAEAGVIFEALISDKGTCSGV